MIQGLYAAAFNDADEFLYAAGRVRVLEGALLRRRDLERAVEGGSVERAWGTLRDASPWWGDRIDAAGLNSEALLAERLVESIREVAFMTPASPVAVVFAIRWDFLRLKDRARRVSFGEGAELERLGRIVGEGGFLLEGGARPDYREALARLSDGLAREHLPQTVDQVLDAEMVRIIFRRLAENPVPFAERFFARRADLSNLGVALRARLRGADRQEARGWLAPGGGLSESLFLEAIGGTGAGSVASWAAPFAATVLGDLVEGLQQTQDEAEAGRRLERLADDHLTELVHAGKYISFGPEPLVGYLHGIEMEIKNVRRLLDGLAQGEETEDILADLRRPYV